MTAVAFKLSMLSTNSDELSQTTTWNGAISLAQSGEALTDLYYQAARGLTSENLLDLLNKAWAVDHLLTLRMIAYIRDIRGGKGERHLGRCCLLWLAGVSANNLLHNLKHYVGIFGRWDDLVDLYPVAGDAVLDVVIDQLTIDQRELEAGNSISMLAKWVPSERSNREFNSALAKRGNMTHKQLRQLLARLKAKLDIVETKLTNGQLELIDYSKVPSVAMKRYGKADRVFMTKDAERFAEWKAGLVKGETKVNTTGLYPHEIVKSYMNNVNANTYTVDVPVLDELLEAQWSGLVTRLSPKCIEYLGDCLVLSDVSGSMYAGTGTAIYVSIALGLMISGLNPNPHFKNMVLTFSEHPKFHHVTGDTLCAKINSLKKAEWGGSTNFQAAYGEILSKAIKFKLKADDMPKTLIVVSDMQFNSADRNTNFQAMQDKYAEAGYNLPRLVFWNVNGSTTDFPVSANQADCAMISGFSVDILQDVLSGEAITPFRVMLRALSRPAYEVIQLVETQPSEPVRPKRVSVKKSQSQHFRPNKRESA